MERLGQAGSEKPGPLKEEEHITVFAYVTKEPMPPPEPPYLRDATHILVNNPAGFPGHKNDGDPEAKTLWIGLQLLNGITNMRRVMSAHQNHDTTVISKSDYDSL